MKRVGKYRKAMIRLCEFSSILHRSALEFGDSNAVDYVNMMETAAQMGHGNQTLKYSKISSHVLSDIISLAIPGSLGIVYLCWALHHSCLRSVTYCAKRETLTIHLGKCTTNIKGKSERKWREIISHVTNKPSLQEGDLLLCTCLLARWRSAAGGMSCAKLAVTTAAWNLQVNVSH